MKAKQHDKLKAHCQLQDQNFSFVIFVLDCGLFRSYRSC